MAKKKVTSTAKKPAKGKKALSTLGRKIDRSRAMVVLRRGGGIDQAKINEKSFTFVLDGQVDPLAIPVKQIDTIIFRNLPLFPLDVIRLAGNEMSGKVTGPDPVHVESAQVGGKVTLRLAEILTIIF